MSFLAILIYKCNLNKIPTGLVLFFFFVESFDLENFKILGDPLEYTDYTLKTISLH